MSNNDSSRASFLKAAGVSILGLPALGGMAAPILSGHLPHELTTTNALPQAIAKVANLSTPSTFIMGNSPVYQTLEGAGPFTVFAPSDQAFANLSPGRQKELQDPTILTAVLEYHVINGAYVFKDLMPGKYTTLLNETLTVTRIGKGMLINRALVVRPNGSAINGRFYIIDKVLLKGFKT
jgi:uncharacterized surface protein with fasciclin (FAS1) repeats